MALYEVTTKGEDKVRLVEAESAAQAIRHCAEGMFTTRTIQAPADVAKIMQGGVKLETAGVAPAAEPAARRRLPRPPRPRKVRAERTRPTPDAPRARAATPPGPRMATGERIWITRHESLLSWRRRCALKPNSPRCTRRTKLGPIGGSRLLTGRKPSAPSPTSS
jgi:hypothetical protein